MATITSAQSGNWSAGATWVGGNKPADGDAVVVAASHNILMDDDLSAYTGLQTVTINGGVTPGMLYFKNGTSGYLKIRTGYNLVGTLNTNRGRLLANSDGVWGNTGSLDNADKAVIDLQGTAKIDAANLDIALYGTNPTNKFVHCYGAKYDFDGATKVDPANDTIDLGVTPPDVGTSVILLLNSGASMPGGLYEDRLYYIRAVSGNTCKLASTNSDEDIVDITSDGSGTISLLTPQASGTSTLNVFEDVTGDSPWSTTAGHNRAVLVDAQAPENYDQQRITLSTITATQITISADVDSPQFAGTRLYLSSRNVSIRNNNTSSSQAIVDYSGSPTRSGIFQNEIVNTAGSGTTFYGYGINSGSGHNIPGIISGCNYGINSGSGHNIPGIISGCNYGINYGSGHNIPGIITGCNCGIYSGSGHNIPGIVTGCNYSFAFPIGNAIAKSGHKIDQVFSGRNVIGNIGRLAMEDYLGIPNAYKIVDNMGDIVKTACDGTGDAPSVDPDGGHGDCIEASNIQSNIGNTWGSKLVIFDKHRIWLAAGTHTITYKLQTTYAGLSAGNLKLIVNYINGASPLARTEAANASAITQRSSNSDWSQTLAVVFTSALAGWVDCAMELYKYEAGNEIYVWPTPVVN